MSDFDFNNAEPARAMGDLIPDNTVALVVINLREGGAGPGGLLKASSTGCNMLDLEFTIDGGAHDRRKFWENWVTDGVTEGHEKAAMITRSRVRATLESAFGINPGDDSEAAMAKRRLNGWGGIDGLKICVKLGVETGSLKDKTAGAGSERYADKNRIKAILTPGETDYIAPGPQIGGFQTAGAVAQKMVANAGAKAVAKPAWAS